MKERLLLLLFLSSTLSSVYSQQLIIVRYDNDFYETPFNTAGYNFCTFKSNKEFHILDSLWYSFIKQRVDSIELCPDSVKCKYPDVRHQIIVVDGNKYDILSSDGSTAMEKNGRIVIFDKLLQTNINNAIKSYEKTLPPEKRTKDFEESMEELRKKMSNDKK